MLGTMLGAPGGEGVRVWLTWKAVGQCDVVFGLFQGGLDFFGPGFGGHYAHLERTRCSHNVRQH